MQANRGAFGGKPLEDRFRDSIDKFVEDVAKLCVGGARATDTPEASCEASDEDESLRAAQLANALAENMLDLVAEEVRFQLSDKPPKRRPQARLQIDEEDAKDRQHKRDMERLKVHAEIDLKRMKAQAEIDGAKEQRRDTRVVDYFKQVTAATAKEETRHLEVRRERYQFYLTLLITVTASLLPLAAFVCAILKESVGLALLGGVGSGGALWCFVRIVPNVARGARVTDLQVIAPFLAKIGKAGGKLSDLFASDPNGRKEA